MGEAKYIVREIADASGSLQDYVLTESELMERLECIVGDHTETPITIRERDIDLLLHGEHKPEKDTGLEEFVAACPENWDSNREVAEWIYNEIQSAVKGDPEEREQWIQELPVLNGTAAALAYHKALQDWFRREPGGR